MGTCVNPVHRMRVALSDREASLEKAAARRSDPRAAAARRERRWPPLARRLATCRFSCRRIVSSLTGIPKRFIRRSPGRPPATRPKFSGPPSAPRVRRNDSGRLIRKCPALTISVQTSPTAHPKFHGHDGALHGQVLKISEIPAVSPCRLLAATWARAYLRPNRRDHPATSIPLGAQNPHARPRGPI